MELLHSQSAFALWKKLNQRMYNLTRRLLLTELNGEEGSMQLAPNI